MVGVAVFPIGSQYELGTVFSDNARNLLPILDRINHSAIRQAEVFAKSGTHPGRGFLRLFVALLAGASRSHFASGEIHDTE
jgi:hypothetical protein